MINEFVGIGIPDDPKNEWFAIVMDDAIYEADRRGRRSLQGFNSLIVADEYSSA